MSAVNSIALTLVIIGALNWGLVGLFNFDLVASVLGAGSTAARIVYILVAVAGLWAIAFYPLVSRSWESSEVAEVGRSRPVAPMP